MPFYAAEPAADSTTAPAPGAARDHQFGVAAGVASCNLCAPPARVACAGVAKLSGPGGSVKGCQDA